jgi:hypothetical protein
MLLGFTRPPAKRVPIDLQAQAQRLESCQAGCGVEPLVGNYLLAVAVIAGDQLPVIVKLSELVTPKLTARASSRWSSLSRTFMS